MNEELKIIISAEINNLKQNVDTAKKQVKSFKDQVADAKKNVDADFKAAGQSIKTGLTIGAGAIAASSASTDANVDSPRAPAWWYRYARSW